MKRKPIISLIFLFILISFAAYSQNDSVTVKRSDDKVIIGGKMYYIHIVEKGQTLYSISKAYNVSQRAIARENPDIFLGLRPEQALKIPYSPGEEDQFQAQAKDDADFQYHKVKKGETLYSLSKRYNVSIETIKDHNPVLYEQELKVRQEVKIPREEKQVQVAVNETERETAKDTLPGIGEDQRKGNFIYHRVRKKETLYSLSKQYCVDIEAIKEANVYLRQGELQYGSVIRIPVSAEAKETELFTGLEAEPVEGLDSVMLKYTNIEEYTTQCNPDNYFKRNEINVTLFLPLYTSKNYEKYYIDSSEVDDKGEKIYKRVQRDRYYIYPPAENFIEFYEGVLIALDSIRRSGIAVNVRVFDTQKDEDIVRTLLFDKDFRNTDLIIGPVYKNTFQLVSEFAKENEIDIISPFARHHSWLANHEHLIQIYPSQEAQLERFASYISQFNKKNMVLVHTGDSLYYPEVRQFRNNIFKYMDKDTSLQDIRFKEVAFKDSLFYLEQAMNKDEENIVIVPSDHEAFVADVVTNLNTLANKDYDIRVFGYSQWQDFVNIDQEYFYNLELNLFTPFHVDYTRDPVKNVVRYYRKVYKSEPSRFVFHGFDIAYYFLNSMYKFGEGYKDCMHTYDPELCHSDYQFYKREDKYGIENVSIVVLEYKEDYTIKEVKLSLKPKQPKRRVFSVY